MEIPTILVELDTKRIERGMSYQAVADACGVSKATIYRALTGVTEPTIQLVQRIEAAVQYVPPASEHLPPSDYSQEEYINYLRSTIRQQNEDYNRHTMQMQTHYSMLHRQDRRTITLLAVCVAVLVIFLVTWLVFDVLHPEIGWIRQ